MIGAYWFLSWANYSISLKRSSKDTITRVWRMSLLALLRTLSRAIVVSGKFLLIKSHFMSQICDTNVRLEILSFKGTSP